MTLNALVDQNFYI